MPTPRSERFDAEQRTSHTGIRALTFLTAAGQVIQENVPLLPSGKGVRGDRTTPTRLTLDSDVAWDTLTAAARKAIQEESPDLFVQAHAGIRYFDTGEISRLHNSVETWTPTPGGPGVMVGTVVDENGDLTLGGG